MKNILILMLLLLSIISFQTNAQTQEEATLLECNTCYTDIDFITTAKQNSPGDGVWYFVIDNYDTQTFKTVRVIEIQDPDLGYFKRARIISNLPEHITSFDGYLQEKQRNPQGIPLQLELPESIATTYNQTADAVIINFARSHHTIASANIRGPKTYPLVQVNFKDGSSAILAYLSATSSVGLVVLAIFDENGNLVNTFSVSPQFGNEGSSTPDGGRSNYLTLPGGVLICYGECVLRDGIVIVEHIPNSSE